MDDPTGFVPQDYEWMLDQDAELSLRRDLAALAPPVRAELWWWISQRGRETFQPLASDIGDLDPGPDVIVNWIRDDDIPRHRMANYTLAMYACLTKFDDPQEWLLASKAGQKGLGVQVALAELPPLPDDWQSTLIGAAVYAVGIATRIS